MAYDGPAFYDNDAVFQTYMRRRQRADNPNDTMEKPVILELIGDLAHQHILDLGCGDATFGREALANGCHSYLGVDGSRNMVSIAQHNLAGTSGRVIQAAIEDWEYPTQEFDLIVSRLVLHYINDIDVLLNKIYQALTDGGRFVFSVEHPIITSSDHAWQGTGKRQDWLVDNYFDPGQRITSWMGEQIIKYHRTVEGYFASLQRAHFRVESLREAMPQPEYFGHDEETYQRRRRIPLFLIMGCRTS